MRHCDAHAAVCFCALIVSCRAVCCVMLLCTTVSNNSSMGGMQPAGPGPMPAHMMGMASPQLTQLGLSPSMQQVRGGDLA